MTTPQTTQNTLGEGAEQSKKERKNFARRERLHPHWPFKVYVYRCWPLTDADSDQPQIGPMPQAVWDTAHEMRRLWNDFTAIFYKVLTEDKKNDEGQFLLSKDERRAIWSALDVKSLREVAKARSDKLDSYCREAVVVDFVRTVGQWRKNPRRYGPPKFQPASEMRSVRIPLTFAAGISSEALVKGTATAKMSYSKPFKNEAPTLYLNNGYFAVGIERERVSLHVAYGGRSGQNKRFLPEDARIKQVLLCGRKDSAFSWEWSLNVRLEHPPRDERQSTGRVCGWDSAGWRRIRDDEYGDRIRFGVIADNAGHFYELSLPWNINAQSRRRRREKELCEKRGWTYDKPETWDQLEALDAEYGQRVEACKRDVQVIYQQEKHHWPATAHNIMRGIAKMRDAGLKKLCKVLEKEYPTSAAIDVIYRWEGQSRLLNETIRAYEKHAANVKRNVFLGITKWLEGFDVISWEGDLSLRDLAEDAGKRKAARKQQYAETGQWQARTPEERQAEESQRYRQIVGQSQLRQFVQQQHQGRLLNEKAAYSTRTCSECGAAVEPGLKLFLVCENGHKMDQDVNASLYFLKKIEGYASISAPPLEIPCHLRPYVRVMAANEVRRELSERR